MNESNHKLNYVPKSNMNDSTYNVEGNMEYDSPSRSSAGMLRPQSFRSAFFNFMRDFRQEYKVRGHRSVNFLRLGSRRWRAMSQTDRAPYILEAAAVRRAKGKAKEIEKKNNSPKPGPARDRNRCPECGQRRKKHRSPSSTSCSRSHSGSRSASRHKSYVSTGSSGSD